jgi:hypothetical protein
MRTITVKNDETGKSKKIKIRALKRKEIRALGHCGYSALGCNPQIETAKDCVDMALEMVLTDDEQLFLDECENDQAVKCWRALLKETYGSKDEEKNLSATGSGTTTESE